MQFLHDETFVLSAGGTMKAVGTVSASRRKSVGAFPERRERRDSELFAFELKRMRRLVLVGILRVATFAERWGVTCKRSRSNLLFLQKLFDESVMGRTWIPAPVTLTWPPRDRTGRPLHGVNDCKQINGSLPPTTLSASGLNLCRAFNRHGFVDIPVWTNWFGSSVKWFDLIWIHTHFEGTINNVATLLNLITSKCNIEN